MSTGNTLRIITGALIVIALMSVTVFATVGQPKATADIASNNAVEKETTEITYKENFLYVNNNIKTMVLRIFIN